jgi:hypothetical protein
VILLSEADSAAHNGGFLFHGRITLYPPGYPALLAFLLRMGIAHTWVIVAMNAAFYLLLGLFAVRYIVTLTFFQGAALRPQGLRRIASFIRVHHIRYYSANRYSLFLFCDVLPGFHGAHPESESRRALLAVSFGELDPALRFDCSAKSGLGSYSGVSMDFFSHPAIKTYLKTRSQRSVIAAIGSLAFAIILVLGWTAEKFNVSLRDFESKTQGHTLANTASAIVKFRLANWDR